MTRDEIKKLQFNFFNIIFLLNIEYNSPPLYSHTQTQNVSTRLGAKVPFPVSNPVRLRVLELSLLLYSLVRVLLTVSLPITEALSLLTRAAGEENSSKLMTIK